MGTILASAIIGGTDGLSGIRGTLHDTDSGQYRWSVVKLLEYLNDAQRFIVMHVPKANITNTAWVLAAGTVQTIPAGGIELIDIMFNMGTGGTTLGNAITLIDKKEMNLLRPSWPTDTASATVQHWMFDENDPTHFLVYPKQPASSFGYVQGSYSAVPTALTVVGDAISLPDIYESPIKNFMLYKAYALETDEYALAQATAYYNACVTEIGRKDMIMQAYSPNRQGSGK